MKIIKILILVNSGLFFRENHLHEIIEGLKSVSLVFLRNLIKTQMLVKFLIFFKLKNLKNVGDKEEFFKRVDSFLFLR